MAFNELYTQVGFPVFQNKMFQTAASAKACATGNIRIVQDSNTGLIFNAAFDPALVFYDQSYQNEQANSDAFRSHLDAVSDLIFDKMNKENLCEIGCGKAGFFELLSSRGAEIVGFDPAYEGDNPKISKALFTNEAGISADGIVLRHVLEHIQDPVEFLYAIKAANGGKGLIYIEVPCFDWIAQKKCWFDIFYEHVNYFRLADFENMFGELVYGERGFGGQYLMVIADLAKLQRPVMNPGQIATLPDDFKPNELQIKKRLNNEVVVWGGASKGVIFSLILQRWGLAIDRLIDVNPAKQNKFVAVTGIKVLSAEEGLRGLPAQATIFVMNPMYLNEISKIGGPNFNYQLA